MRGFSQQLEAVLRKNLILKKRVKSDYLREIIPTVLLLVALYSLGASLSDDSYGAKLDYSADVLHPGADYGNAGTVVAFAPCASGDNVHALMEAFGDVAVDDWDLECYESADDLTSDATSNPETFQAAVVVTSAEADLLTADTQFAYTLMLNRTTLDWRTLQDDFQSTTSAGPSSTGDDWKNSGFLSMQLAVDTALARLRTGDASVDFGASVQWAPFPAYTDNVMVQATEVALPTYVSLLFSFLVRTSLARLLEEKEKKLRVGLRMIGLSDAVYTVSWLLTFFVVLFVVSLLTCVVLRAGDMLAGVDFFLLFFTFVGYVLSLISFVLLVAAFANTARVGSLLGFLGWYILSLPEILVTDSDTSTTTRGLVFLSAPSAFAMSLNIMNDADASGSHLTFGNWGDAGLTQYNCALSFSTLMTFLDAGLYLLGAWYAEKVVPSEFGTTLPWYFFLQPSYWFPSTIAAPQANESEQALLRNVHGQTAADETLASMMEDVAEDELEVGAHIFGLGKTFSTPEGEKRAVDNLHIKMYKGQIFALLGHNGAGKSTAISMLTGLYPPTDGDAFLNGYSVRTQLHEVQHQIGICPQHDVLWDHLTVREHLVLFGGVKGVDKQRLPAVVEESIRSVGLEDKADTRTMALSGGMKRKLSVAIALIGDPKVVFLDEPTSGMDPYSRRATWDLLERSKEGRVIVLTTHFMDEADLLGDRIGIMSHGQLRVCGSSLFLKSKFGIGYSLTMACEPGRDPQAVTAFVREHVSASEEVSTAGSELTYQLPLQSSAAFPTMLAQLDDRKAELGVDSYGISVTSLEEVFLRFTQEEEARIKELAADTPEAAALRSSTFRSLGRSQYSSVDTGDGDPENPQNNQLSSLAKSGPTTFLSQFKPLFRRRLIYGKRDKKAMCLQIALPLAFLLLSLVILSASGDDSTDTTIKLTTAQFAGHTGTSQSVFDLPYASQTSSEVTALDVLADYADDSGMPDALNVGLMDMDDFEVYMLDQQTEESLSQIGGVSWTGATAYTLLFNTTAYNSQPILMGLIHSAILSNLTSTDTMTEQAIQPKFEAFPLAVDEDDDDPLTLSIAFQTALYTTIGFGYIPAMMGVFVVREREFNVRHQLNVSGVNALAYWASNLAYDLLLFLVPMFGAIVLFFVVNTQAITAHTGGVLLLLIMFAVAAAPMTYALSFFFDKHTTAQTMLTLLHSVLGMVWVIASFIIELINEIEDGDPLQGVLDAINYVGYALPTFCLGRGLMTLAEQTCTDSADGCTVPATFDWDMLGAPLCFLAVYAGVYSLLAAFLEVRSTSGARDDNAASLVVDDDAGEANEDEAVQDERARVRAGKADHENIVVRGLRKVFPARGGQPPKLAVRDFALGIPAGECFGLLGVNGAGKTTTIQMLTGAVRPTAGDAHLAGHSVLTQLDDVLGDLGYCPQFDALLPLLTAREHLEMYARVKGVPEAEVQRTVAALIEHATLSEHADFRVEGYSGGNKRKLSLAIALLGNPSIVFLDEPSTGMDPWARRATWKLVQEALNDCSVLLTTHSMEEADALCTRIGIMVNGAMACLGSSQGLKSRYGHGYYVEISLRADAGASQAAHDQLKQFLEALCPETEFLEWHGAHLKARVPTDRSLADMFAAVEERKQDLGIEHYSVSQTTLEQIFLQHAKKQEESSEV